MPIDYNTKLLYYLKGISQRAEKEDSVDKKNLIEQITKLLETASTADCAVVLEFVQHLTRP